MTKSKPANSRAPYRLKIERAKRHIGELTAEIETYLAGKPYEIFAEEDQATAKRLYKIRVKQAVPFEWSAIVGDTIHNARSALDILMVEIVKLCDPNRASYNHVHFVVGQSKDIFETRLPKNIQGASAEARRLVEDLKPYKGGDEAFWMLHQLDITNKHKAIIPVGSAHSGLNIDMNQLFDWSSVPWMKEAIAAQGPAYVNWTPTHRQFPLEDGTTIFSTSLETPLNDNLQASFEIAFGEGQILDGEPVVPALTQIVEFVEGVIDAIEIGLPGLGR